MKRPGSLKSSSFLCHCSLPGILTVFMLIAIHCSLLTSSFAADKWQGVDESVVEKYAKEHGRQPAAPFINTDQGDLLLFVFLIAGTVGGFAAGYYWRVLTEKKITKPQPGKDTLGQS